AVENLDRVAREAITHQRGEPVRPETADHYASQRVACIRRRGDGEGLAAGAQVDEARDERLVQREQRLAAQRLRWIDAEIASAVCAARGGPANGEILAPPRALL